MRDSAVVDITREELYQRVWTTPMRTLAGEWGLSDVGLVKICKRHQIPRPAPGHWAKKRHGKRVRRVPLPPIDDDRLNTITISPVERVDGPTIGDAKIAQLILQEAEPDRAITVSEQTPIRHPFVRTTKEALKGRQPDEYGRVCPDWQISDPHFVVQVSPRNVSRALRILQSLTSAMQARGYALKEPADKSRQPYFEVMGEAFRIDVRESSKRSLRKPDDSKPHSWWSHRYDYTPTGILELCVERGSCGSGVTLRDTKRKPLESRLNKVVVAILRIVDCRRQQAERNRIEAIQKAERKRIAIEQEIARRSDSARIERLKHLTQLWETHRRFSAFVNAVRYEAESQAPSVDPETVDWLTWADAFLREIDPLSDGNDLPGYSLTQEEREQLRRECEADWNQWSETFQQRRSSPTWCAPSQPR